MIANFISILQKGAAAIAPIIDLIWNLVNTNWEAEDTNWEG